MFTHLSQLNSLRVFESAARLGSFKAAAEELNVTPTAISHQIANLEDKLGILLFERKTRLVTLTQEGEKLAQSVHYALQQIASSIEDITDDQSVLRVATTTSFAALWLVPNLGKFHAAHPNIQVELRTEEALVDIKHDRRIDLAIRYGSRQKVEAQENATVLVTEQFNAYATANYIRHNKSLSKVTLIETRWKNKNLSLANWQQWFQKYKKEKPPLNIRSFDQEHHAIHAAIAGQGIVLASSVLVQMALQQGWLQPHKAHYSLPGLSYYLLCSPFSENSKKVQLFREWLSETLLGKPLADFKDGGK